MVGKVATGRTPESAVETVDPYRPLSSTLCAVACEISELAQLSDRLQSLISAALMADGSANPDHVREFQAIDLLVQRLHGVASFVDALGASTPVDLKVDAAAAASGVPLSDLARRLGGACAPTDTLNQTQSLPTGDVDLFG